VEVRPVSWLRRGGWDAVVVAAHEVETWQPRLAAAGVEAHRVIALPADEGEDDALLGAIASTLFPDPLTDALAAASAIGSAVASLGDVPSSFAVSAAATGVADGSGFIAIASSRLTVRSLKQ